MTSQSSTKQINIITPPSRWEFIDFKELYAYRDLFYFLVWRDIKVLYAQTILGFAWAILNPLIQILVFTIVFGNIAKVSTGETPYILFSTVAVIPWSYMSDAMTKSSQSLVTGQNMLGKIYFPRIIFPLTPILAKTIDFAISLLLLVAVLGYFGIKPTWNLLAFPFFFVLMVCVPAAIGFCLSALAIRFRDVKFAMTFALKMLIYTAPVLYSIEAIPSEYRIWYALNPIVSVIEGFRFCALGGDFHPHLILPGAIVGLLLLGLGAAYFRRMERVFVDVI